MNKMLMAVAVALALCGGPAYAVNSIDRWPNASSNVASATPMIDTDPKLNLDTPTAGSKGDALRTSVTDMRRTTGDSTTSFTITAFNETATRIIDTDASPVRGLMIFARSATSTQLQDSTVGYGVIGISVFGKTAANLRQGFLSVRPGEPIILNDLFWYNTPGDSVSIFVESSSAAASFLYDVQVIR